MITAPFPYFGGKRRVADLINFCLGEVSVYLEPFFGSGVVLLNRPPAKRMEVVNDINFYIANFFRAVRHNPEEVIRFADEPGIHVELHARHKWLCSEAVVTRLRDNLQDCEWPGDAKVAGWWLWGAAYWIGGGWCAGTVGDKSDKVLRTSDSTGVGRQVLRTSNSTGVGFGAWQEAVHAVGDRMRHVRINNVSWERSVPTSAMRRGSDSKLGVFFDPPYAGFESLYADNATESVAHAVGIRALELVEEFGDRARICLAGHDGDYDLPGWYKASWKRRPAYGNEQGSVECLWFSPACRDPSEFVKK